MTGVAADHPARGLLARLKPIRHAGRYRFVALEDPVSLPAEACICLMREAEGLSAIVAVEHVPPGARVMDFPASWITLGVESSLDGVGLTAAVAQRLADAGIACNVVAAIHHDHLFVPEADADRAMAELCALQQAAARAGDIAGETTATRTTPA
ncbi:ACT domain-containing protein [Salinisphaera sp. T31B1]|uniref:ACT domain-containing protein n=1 Tax=Salinisphaera sp. T31B1 TaxID=727963 RepID=UPI003342C463